MWETPQRIVEREDVVSGNMRCEDSLAGHCLSYDNVDLAGWETGQNFDVG